MKLTTLKELIDTFDKIKGLNCQNKLIFTLHTNLTMLLNSLKNSQRQHTLKTIIFDSQFGRLSLMFGYIKVDDIEPSDSAKFERITSLIAQALRLLNVTQIKIPDGSLADFLRTSNFKVLSVIMNKAKIKNLFHGNKTLGEEVLVEHRDKLNYLNEILAVNNRIEEIHSIQKKDLKNILSSHFSILSIPREKRLNVLPQDLNDLIDYQAELKIELTKLM